MKRSRSLVTFVIIISLLITSFNFQKQTLAEGDVSSNQLDYLEKNIENNLESMGLEQIDVTAQLPMSNQEELVDLAIEEDPQLEEEFLIEEEELTYEELTLEDEQLTEEMKEEFDILTDEVENVIEENDLVIQIIGLDDTGEEFSTTIGLNLGEDEVNLVTTSDNQKEFAYSLDLEELNEDNISGTLTDKITGETINLESDLGEYTSSAVFVPALGITLGSALIAGFAIVVGAAVLIYLAAKGLISLYKGALWVAGKVAQEQQKNRKWVHYQARRVNNKLGILVGPGQSQTKAVNRLKANADVWSINSTQAKKIAKTASSYKDTLYHRPHKASKGVRTFHHYHPKGKSSHSFYGLGKAN
ncbi:hypothetical protein HXZ66_16815 [Bacillus sp. A116_S68]|nr:hypothetical protein HXZ66_16815 [Bacillus sp. A116_S68]